MDLMFVVLANAFWNTNIMGSVAAGGISSIDIHASHHNSTNCVPLAACLGMHTRIIGRLVVTPSTYIESRGYLSKVSRIEPTVVVVCC
ncbi:hypothetical protein Plhal710r2_c082g0180541 [Plasmopara halstedii]